MMLQMSATPLSPAVQSEVPRPRPAGKMSSPRPSWYTASVREFMTSHRDGTSELGRLAAQSWEENFRDASPRTLKAGETLELPETMVIAGNADVVIESTNDGCVVTGIRGRQNECRLIFRHAYDRARCTVHVPAGAVESRITFLRSPSQSLAGPAELQSFHICQSHHGSRGGGSGFSTTLDYQAEALNEVQGILWRGGLLQISRISLKLPEEK